MTQQRMQSLYTKTRTDAVWLVNVAKEFVSQSDNHKHHFGTFPDADLHISQLSRLAYNNYDEPEKGPTWNV